MRYSVLFLCVEAVILVEARVFFLISKPLEKQRVSGTVDFSKSHRKSNKTSNSALDSTLPMQYIAIRLWAQERLGKCAYQVHC